MNEGKKRLLNSLNLKIGPMSKHICSFLNLSNEVFIFKNGTDLVKIKFTIYLHAGGTVINLCFFMVRQLQIEKKQNYYYFFFQQIVYLFCGVQGVICKKNKTNPRVLIGNKKQIFLFFFNDSLFDSDTFLYDIILEMSFCKNKYLHFAVGYYIFFKTSKHKRNIIYLV